MTKRTRLIVFALACLTLLPAFTHVAARMPTFGAHPLPYGDAINASGIGERHVTNMVTAVNFDYRGIDTLGEEFMLLCAVTGVTLLLRSHRGERQSARPGRVPGRAIWPRSDAVVLMCRLAAVTTFVFGLYVALHATSTPGGGFQGGVIIASSSVLIYLGEGYEGWRVVIRSEVMDAVEGAGAAIYALAGLVPMLAGAPFLTNLLPLGQPGDAFSGGLMLVLNAGVTLAVTGGFTALFLEFLEETREEDERS